MSGSAESPQGVIPAWSRRVLRVTLALSLMAGCVTASSLVTAGSATAAPSAGATAAPTTAAGVSVEDLCGTPAPGRAQCLGLRQVRPATASLSGRNSTTGGSVTPAAGSSGLTPANLASAYKLDTTKGVGQTVAIVDAYDAPNAESYLATYRAQFGLPACTTANGCFKKVNQTGAASPLPAADAGWAGEIALDLDMVSAVCPQCSILLVEARTSYLSDLGAAVNTAVSMGAKFVSNSYGGSEYSGDGADSDYNHPGVAITVSTGDNGYGTSFPATSPYVTAVGGTSLVAASNSRGWNESVWSGAGSGCSPYVAKPAFQASVATGCANRAVADVSAVADPYTGVAVYNGGWGVYGGTSASAPIVAAAYALAGTPGANDYPNTYPYAHADQLFDVTSGSNGSCGGKSLCSAAVGWDGPTGLGTPDTAAALSATGTVSGSPGRFTASATVASPAIAGLPSQAHVVPALPDGDSLAGVTWKSGRSDCTFSSTTSLDPTVTCNAATTSATTVTVTAKDVAGATKVITMPLTFDSTSAKRDVAISATVTGQTGSPQSVCSGYGTGVTAQVVDAATGTPVKGLTLSFTRQSGATAATVFGGKVTLGDGTVSSTLAATVTTNLGARTAALGRFNAGASGTVSVVPSKCTPSISASVDKTAVYYGDTITVSGTLTRDLNGGPTPIAGAKVQVLDTVNGKAGLLAAPITAADGSFTAAVRATASGSLTVALPASASWTATTTALGTLTVATPNTVLTGAAASSDIGYGDALTVSGTLIRDAGGAQSGVNRGVVTIINTPAVGKAYSLGAATAAANGTWTATVHPTVGGQLSASYAGAAGQPAAVISLSSLTVGTWTTALTATSQLTSQLAGTKNRVSGTVTRSYNGVTSNAPGVLVKVYLKTTTGKTVLLGAVKSASNGTYSVLVAPSENGGLESQVTGVPGYANAASTDIPLTVTTKVVASAPHTVPAGKVFSLKATVSAKRSVRVTVAVRVGSSWHVLSSKVTAAAGSAKIAVHGLSKGKHTLRITVAGDRRGRAGHSSTFVVTAR